MEIKVRKSSEIGKLFLTDEEKDILKKASKLLMDIGDKVAEVAPIDVGHDEVYDTDDIYDFEIYIHRLYGWKD